MSAQHLEKLEKKYSTIFSSQRERFLSEGVGGEKIGIDGD